MAGESEGLRCPECGERFPLGFTVCSGCGGSLVPDEPIGEDVSGDDAEAADAGSVAYDLEGWTPAQRDALELLLTGREVPHEWSRAHVVVPAARADEIDDLLDGLGPEPPPPGPVRDEPRRDDAVESAPAIEHVIAGPGRRLLGAAVDVAVWTIMDLGLTYSVLSGDDAGVAHAVMMPAVTAAYEIVSVALWGRTIGKLVAGTRVVALESGAIPGWSRAILRWAVPWIAGLGPFIPEDGLAAGLVAAAAGVLTIFVYVGLLKEPLRQGVHDKVAGTVVVLVPRTREDAVDRSGTGSVGAVPPPP